MKFMIRTERALPSLSFFLFRRPPTEQNFSTPPSRNLGSLHATIVTCSSSSTSINSSSRSKREKSRCLSFPRVSRSTGTIFGIIHSVAWNYICINVTREGKMIVSLRQRFLYSVFIGEIDIRETLRCSSFFFFLFKFNTNLNLPRQMTVLEISCIQIYSIDLLTFSIM